MSTLASQSSHFSAQTAPDGADDLEKAPVDRVLAALDVQADKGLTSAEAQKRLATYGPNAIVEKKESLARKILRHLPQMSPLRNEKRKDP